MNYKYKSILAPIIFSFIEFKHSLGFKYQSEEWKLKEIDLLAIHENLDENRLTKEFVELFIKKKANESNTNITHRVEVVRELAKYMINNEYEAYILPPLPRGSYDSTFTPHIFTNRELQKIFKAVDDYSISLSLDNHKYPERAKYPVILRILYSTGMRIGEVVNLKIKNINFENNTFTIEHAKNDKERIIPVHQVTMNYLHNFIIDHKIFNEDSYIFHNKSNQSISISTVYTIFRKVLLLAGIPHYGKGKGPRVHSFRHTYCVHRLRDWVLDGRDITALFPYLCAYMGHSDTRCTEYYLRLTAELYPDIVMKSEKYFNEGSNIDE